MNQYYIVSYPGAGKSFFVAVLGQYLNKLYNDIPISSSGHCHDIGNGIYKSTDDICQMSWHIETAINNSKKIILSGHYTNLKNIKQILPNHKIILLEIDDSILKTILTMRFYKTMNPMSEKEYDKWINKFKIKHWPSYSEVVADPEIVKDDILNLDAVWYKEWVNEIDKSQVDYVIKCETILGLNNQNLNHQVAKIVNKEIDPTIDKFIKRYQTINQTLYVKKH